LKNILTDREVIVLSCTTHLTKFAQIMKTFLSYPNEEDRVSFI